MTAEESRRLADIRKQNTLWGATSDISIWDSTFLLKIIDSQKKELLGLRKTLRSSPRS